MSQSASRLQNHIAGIYPDVEENIEILTSVKMGDVVMTVHPGNIMLLKKLINVFFGLQLKANVSHAGLKEFTKSTTETLCARPCLTQ